MIQFFWYLVFHICHNIAKVLLPVGSYASKKYLERLLNE